MFGDLCGIYDGTFYLDASINLDQQQSLTLTMSTINFAPFLIFEILFAKTMNEMEFSHIDVNVEEQHHSFISVICVHEYFHLSLSF